MALPGAATVLLDGFTWGSASAVLLDAVLLDGFTWGSASAVLLDAVLLDGFTWGSASAVLLGAVILDGFTWGRSGSRGRWHRLARVPGQQDRQALQAGGEERQRRRRRGCCTGSLPCLAARARCWHQSVGLGAPSLRVLGLLRVLRCARGGGLRQLGERRGRGRGCGGRQRVKPHYAFQD